MACVENLIPQAHVLTDEDRAKGYAKRMENKARKKALKECLEILLERDIKANNGETMTGAEAISAKLFEQALKGDKKAFEIVRDTAGQKPADKVIVSTVDQNVVDEIESMFNSMKSE